MEGKPTSLPSFKDHFAGLSTFYHDFGRQRSRPEREEMPRSLPSSQQQPLIRAKQDVTAEVLPVNTAYEAPPEDERRNPRRSCRTRKTSPSAPKERRKKQMDTSTNVGRWTKEEQQLFEQAMVMYGRNWRMHKHLIKTREVVQIRTHAQKVFKKLATKGGNPELMRAFGLVEGVKCTSTRMSHYIPPAQALQPLPLPENNLKRPFDQCLLPTTTVNSTSTSSLFSTATEPYLSTVDMQPAPMKRQRQEQNIPLPPPPFLPPSHAPYGMHPVYNSPFTATFATLSAHNNMQLPPMPIPQPLPQQPPSSLWQSAPFQPKHTAPNLQQEQGKQPQPQQEQPRIPPSSHHYQSIA